jgi:hypothetical protein
MQKKFGDSRIKNAAGRSKPAGPRRPKRTKKKTGVDHPPGGIAQRKAKDQQATLTLLD